MTILNEAPPELQDIPESLPPRRRIDDGRDPTLDRSHLRSWQQFILARVDALEARTDALEARALWESRRGSAALDAVTIRRLANACRGHLRQARTAASDRAGRRAVGQAISGSALDRAYSNLNMARAQLLRIAPLTDLNGEVPHVLDDVRQHLKRNDPQREAVERLARRGRGDAALTEAERAVLVSAFEASRSHSEYEHKRVRSFRNLLLLSAATLTVLAIAVAILGALRPSTIPLCFYPGDVVVCVSGEEVFPAESATDAATASADGAEEEAVRAEGVDEVGRRLASSTDYLVVELVGLTAAALAAALSLRQIRGTSTPYSLPVSLALLKLPSGALTALLGLLLMRGGFVPGLSALDSSAQIIAWAIVFGYAQQVFTRFLDRQAQVVLNRVSNAEMDPQAPPAPAPA